MVLKAKGMYNKRGPSKVALPKITPILANVDSLLNGYITHDE